MDNPYDYIVKIIKEWCETHVYEDFLVTINLDGTYITEILELDSSTMNFIWLSDWWEGQKNVSLVGFYPTGNICCYGTPSSGCLAIREE